jgi:hypothetical protein
MDPHEPTYPKLNDVGAAPLTDSAPTVQEMDAAMTSLIGLQQVLDRLPLLRRANLLDALQRVTPATVQRKMAVKKALQTVRYLGQRNRACINFWRAHGISDLAFLDGDAGALRQLPIMKSDFFYDYSPEDRMSIGTTGEAQMLVSSGSTGRPKHFLMSQEHVLQTLPATRQFLRSAWAIDAYDRVEIVVSTAKAEPGEPAWGAGYNMVELMKRIGAEYPHVSCTHVGLSPAAAARHIEQVASRRQAGRTLVAVYTYAPNLVAIMSELEAGQGRVNLGAEVEFRFMLTGEAFPPYKVFQVAEWLGLVEAGLVEKRVDEIVASSAGRSQLRALLRTFSTGFGAAELKSGLSGNTTTMLWTLIMFLLQRNEPDRAQPFLSQHLAGRPFPWTALKAAPHIYLLLGSFDGDGNPTLEDPGERHWGPALATSLAGEVVNCYLGDVIHIWDLEDLASLLQQETGIDIRRIAQALRIPYDRGDMILTNGRTDSPGSRGLDAAASWWGLKLYGHHLQQAAAGLPELTGIFTAQNVDYGDGRRVLWLHVEACKGEDAQTVAGQVRAPIIHRLEALNQEFRAARAQVLAERGEEGFGEEVQLRVLPFGHARFQGPEGQVKHRYIHPPVRVSARFDPAVDPAYG